MEKDACDREGDGFGTLLRQFRLARGLTQEELAERAGLSIRGISDLERGANQRARPDTFARLAQALELDPTERALFDRLPRRSPARRPTITPPPLPSGVGHLFVEARRDLAVDQRGPGGSSGPGAGPNVSHGLPVPLSSFVGRERELDEVARCLESARLLTLVGPPGVGKTRLALAAATRFGSVFADGVRFIPLAAVRDPDLVLAAIARSVGIEGLERQPLITRVAEALRDSRVLLVLDNFEQIVAAGPALSELLEACPRLRMLVTSRTRLRVRGERGLAVSPLSLPEGRLGTTEGDAVATVLRSEAARLFAERAREARPDFAVTGENVPLIADVCCRLDGSPLAIELAAAWVRTLSLPSLSARLAYRLDLLTSGPADLPRRQQTWREAIAWSYDLLKPDEQALFRRLAVFSGDFTFPAAEAVADASLETLTSLLDASLVQRLGNGHPDAEPRFTMLETIRDYADECLTATGEAETRRSRHAAYFLALAEAARRAHPGLVEREALDRLEPENVNLRAALRFYVNRGDVERALRLIGGTGWFWYARGYVNEAHRWVAQILDLARTTGNAGILADALQRAGRWAWLESDNLAARGRLEESLALFRQIGDRANVAVSLGLLGIVARDRGEYVLARALSEESLELCRELGDTAGVGDQLDRVGEIAFYQGDVATGRALVEESLRVRQQLGTPVYIGWALAILGKIAHGTGDHAVARSYYENSLAIWHDHGYRPGRSHILPYVAELKLDEGDLAGARADLVEALALSRARGEIREIVSALEGFAGLSAARRDTARCLRLAGAAARIREAIGEPCTPDRQVRLTRRRASARETLEGNASAAAWAEGRAMTLEQAVAYAREEDDP